MTDNEAPSAETFWSPVVSVGRRGSSLVMSCSMMSWPVRCEPLPEPMP